MSDRPETGAMKFGDDWTGVFIRGDGALHYALSLKALLENSPANEDTALARLVVKGLMELLFSCEEGKTPDVQQLKAFDACLKK